MKEAEMKNRHRRYWILLLGLAVLLASLMVACGGQVPPSSPTIGFSPSSLSFSAQEGGANPSSQTLTIWDSGGATLDWAVTADANWVSLSPTSGASTGESDSVTVSADIYGVDAGNYAATITISAPGASNSPLTIPAELNITPTPTPTPATQAIQVALDYFGIKDTHQPPVVIAPNRIQLYVVVNDGKTKMEFSYPSSGEGIPMEYFQLEDLREQTIFHTSSVGDHLTISVLAYSCADKEATLSVGRALQIFEPSMGPLLDFYEKLPQSKELIGWYEHTWYATEEWGIKQGKYEDEGNGDLKLWFRMWSEKEPVPISQPPFKPEVKIQDVKLPTDAKPGSKLYPITLSLVNSEKFDVPIRWEAVSSITGKFDSGTATVPRNGKLLEIKRFYWWEAGNRTITYTIYYYYNNAKLDTRPETLNITP